MGTIERINPMKEDRKQMANILVFAKKRYYTRFQGLFSVKVYYWRDLNLSLDASYELYNEG